MVSVGKHKKTCRKTTGDCTKKEVVYCIECADCTREGKKSVYFGETARMGWEQHKEHFTLLENHPEKSALGDHSRDDHNGQACVFRMKGRVKAHETPGMRVQ